MDFMEFVEDYYQQYIRVLNAFDKLSLEPVLDTFLDVRDKGGTLWVAGNGGSAAIGDHTVCDVTKGTHTEGEPTIKSISLTSNTAMLTALGNDLDYEQVFSQQLKYYLGKNDALLLVSSSGNSPNVVKACEYANSRGVPTIAFVGFKGGKLRDIAKHCVWIPIENYGMAEDAHQSLMHVTTQYIMAYANQRVAAEAQCD
ncbi:SIS domain-containing protein [SAR92 clade bacterium H455]|uniref:SIS domain-containing protein n=1 Tax=SAR92 clade bacterium H455 TaxID=2974818 RepID=A0ABY5TP79_9GAMM|nr:SIS domain-containing protein [SAR92 clade bacterium H455]